MKHTQCLCKARNERNENNRDYVVKSHRRWRSHLNRKWELGVISSLIIISLLAAMFAFYAHASSPPNIAMPDLSGHCYHQGVTFTTPVTASNLTNTESWQVNITFTPGTIALMSYAIGSPFTGSNTITAVNNDTSIGYFVLGWSYSNGAGPYTITSQVTLVTLTWKTLIYHPAVTFHIVTSAEGPPFTKLLDPGFNNLPYTTTDGFLGCQQLGPSH